MKEKETILAMKVSKLGLKPDESDIEENTSDDGNVDPNTEIRFPKLYDVDQRYSNYKVQNYNNSFELTEFV